MATEALTPGQGWRGPSGVAAACAVLGVLVGATGGPLPAPVAMIGLGTGLVGASFLLSWAADAAEVDYSGGLVLAGVTLVTVLPELVIEVDFAFTQQTALVTANLTGATRLVLTAATAMPLLGAWLLARRGQRAGSLILGPARRVDLAVLSVAAGYGSVVALLGRISLIDGFLLVAIPFTAALEETGTAVGIDRYLIVQSIVPAATETPEFVIAAVLALNRRPAQGLAVFLAASVSQWTLAIGVLPFAYVAGGGGLALPLSTRAEVELALTVSTTLMAVAALSSLAPRRFDSWIILTLYVIQFAFPATEVRIAVAVVLAMFTLDILVANRRAVRPMFGALRSRRPPDSTEPQPRHPEAEGTGDKSTKR